MSNASTRTRTNADGQRVVAFSACSSAFFEYYLDLIESLDDVGLGGRMTHALFDLGLTPQQTEILNTRGVRILEPKWPVDPPAHQSSITFFGLAAKAYLREALPGFDVYCWLDADMWVQTAEFWDPLIDNANKGLFSTVMEEDPGYQNNRQLQLWLLVNYRRGYGLPAALKLCSAPLINNAVAATRADAPHWSIWQSEYEQLVRRTQRLPGMDQLSLTATLYRRNQPVKLLPATYNWVCSRAIPLWDQKLQRFIAPDHPSGTSARRRQISVLHLTTPSRGKAFAVMDTDSLNRTRRYLHRPGGHVSRLLEHNQPATSDKEPPKPQPTVAPNPSN